MTASDEPDTAQRGMILRNGESDTVSVGKPPEASNATEEEEPVTRIDSVRSATGNAKDSVRHAAEVVAPYAESARDTAVHYAQEAGARLGPKVSNAARQARSSARDGYDQYLVPRLHEARKSVPPEWDKAATEAARRTRKAARKAGEFAAPRIEQAVAEARAAAGPAYEEAAGRSNAALAALRSGVSAEEIEKLARRRDRRCRCGRLAKRLGLVGLLAGGAYAAWRWWDRRANPDWLVEPPAATEVGDRTTKASAHEEPAQGEAAQAEEAGGAGGTGGAGEPERSAQSGTQPGKSDASGTGTGKSGKSGKSGGGKSGATESKK